MPVTRAPSPRPHACLLCPCPPGPCPSPPACLRRLPSPALSACPRLHALAAPHLSPPHSSHAIGLATTALAACRPRRLPPAPALGLPLLRTLAACHWCSRLGACPRCLASMPGFGACPRCLTSLARARRIPSASPRRLPSPSAACPPLRALAAPRSPPPRSSLGLGGCATIALRACRPRHRRRQRPPSAPGLGACSRRSPSALALRSRRASLSAPALGAPRSPDPALGARP